MPTQKREFNRRSERIEELVERLEKTGDPAIRAVAQELLQAVIELHGVALDRILQVMAELHDGDDALAGIARDELVSGVLSLHGIHPVDLQQRVAAALEGAKPYLESHGGTVQLASITNGEVHVLLQGACGSCSSSSDTLKRHVQNAIYAVAPEVVAVVAESAPTLPQLVTLQTN